MDLSIKSITDTAGSSFHLGAPELALTLHSSKEAHLLAATIIDELLSALSDIKKEPLAATHAVVNTSSVLSQEDESVIRSILEHITNATGRRVLPELESFPMYNQISRTVAIMGYTNLGWCVCSSYPPRARYAIGSTFTTRVAQDEALLNKIAETGRFSFLSFGSGLLLQDVWQISYLTTLFREKGLNPHLQLHFVDLHYDQPSYQKVLQSMSYFLSQLALHCDHEISFYFYTKLFDLEAEVDLISCVDTIDSKLVKEMQTCLEALRFLSRRQTPKLFLTCVESVEVTFSYAPLDVSLLAIEKMIKNRQRLESQPKPTRL